MNGEFIVIVDEEKKPKFIVDDNLNRAYLDSILLRDDSTLRAELEHLFPDAKKISIRPALQTDIREEERGF
jgi:hypothetical protein